MFTRTSVQRKIPCFLVSRMHPKRTSSLENRQNQRSWPYQSAFLSTNSRFPLPPSASTRASGGSGQNTTSMYTSRQLTGTITSSTSHAEFSTTASYNRATMVYHPYSSHAHAEEAIYVSSDEDLEDYYSHEPNSRMSAKTNVKGLSLIGREWEHVAVESSSTSSSIKSLGFSVMSYNILSQQLLHDNAYLYRTCSPKNLEKNVRMQRIVNELITASPDIMCLQEVEAQFFFDELKPRFEAFGYSCIYKKRTGSKPDGCAILVNMKKFNIIASREIEYFTPNVDLLDRDNVGLLALIEAKSTSGYTNASSGLDTPARLVIANTHLLFNHRRGDIKLAQMQILLAEIDRLALFGVDKNSPDKRMLVYYPVLLCGDLNLEPYSPLYNFLTEGFLRFEGMPKSILSGQLSANSMSHYSNGPIMSRTLLPDSFGLADNSEFADSCTVKSSAKSCFNSLSGAPIVANLSKDVTKTISSVDRSQCRQYYSGSVSHPFLLRPVYNYDIRKKGEFTSLTRGQKHAVDHIFYSVLRHEIEPQTTEGRLRLRRRLKVPDDEVIRNGSIPQPYPSLPVEAAPSDHIPLLAEFSFEVPS